MKRHRVSGFGAPAFNGNKRLRRSSSATSASPCWPTRMTASSGALSWALP
jgi:hypothetical protein